MCSPDNLTWSNNTSSLVRKAHQRLYFLRRLRRAELGSSVLTSFYRCVVDSVLCSSINVWHRSCSAADWKALQSVVKAAQRGRDGLGFRPAPCFQSFLFQLLGEKEGEGDKALQLPQRKRKGRNTENCSAVYSFIFLCLRQTASTPNRRKRGDLFHSEEMPPEPQVRRNFLEFLKSFVGIVRILQILLGAGLWVTIAANKYEGSVHFVLFVAVFFWLLTLALFFLTLLDKQDLVPIVGGQRWLLTNVVHDIAATLLYLSAIGIMIYKTDKNSFCNVKYYRQPCLYNVYLTGSVFACLTACVYLLSAIYGSSRKCRGQQTVV
ncbi:hypothetical protein NFI96_004955 [Prochilodus magdalenae]|nr:hypothetical protein NFI96_004955 [Prochilodus magdalenae]